MEERLQKILAQAGYGSRRSCEDLIVQGRVKVNGQRAELGQKAELSRDQITVDGEVITAREKLTYIVLHKPVGVVSSLNPQGDRRTVADLVPAAVRLYPVGRLDVDSEGLVLLTNDGELTNQLTHPRFGVEKEYRVLVKGDPDEEQLQAWRRGIVLEGRRTLPAQVTRQGRAHHATWLRVIMHEGRKHEIRDIGLTLGMPVERLIRVRLGSLELGDLRAGQWRDLTKAEVAALKASVGKHGDKTTHKQGNRHPRKQVR
jgi:23S rRNA pseudouridine2605 synthase